MTMFQTPWVDEAGSYHSLNQTMAMLRKAIVTGGVRGLNDLGAYAEGRAKYHAPVRRVFKGTRLPKAEFPRARWARGGRILNRGEIELRTSEQYAQFRAGRAKMRERPGPLDVRGLSKAERRRGHANTFYPVFMKKSGSGVLSGDYRKLTPDETDLANKRGRDRLSSRGRWELASGRANFGGRLGGRLRGEIFRTRAALAEGHRIAWVYVVSPTPYAKYQEYGTSHNRAHPYLRPALYESRLKMKPMIVKAIREALRASMVGRIS